MQENYDPAEGMSSFLQEDFSLEDEYKPEPLIPKSNCRGNVLGVNVDAERSAIVWKVALAENGTMCTDGKTPVDGQHVYFRNWLPKPGDENEMEANGRVTKRQGKINRLKRFADGMAINMDTPQTIASSIEDQIWVGSPVVCSIDFNEYQGNISNQVQRMVRDPQGSTIEVSDDDEIPF